MRFTASLSWPMNSPTTAGEMPAFFINEVAVCRSAWKEISRTPPACPPLPTVGVGLGLVARVGFRWDQAGLGHQVVELSRQTGYSSTLSRDGLKGPRVQRLLRIVAGCEGFNVTTQRHRQWQDHPPAGLPRHKAQLVVRAVRVGPSEDRKGIAGSNLVIPTTSIPRVSSRSQIALTAPTQRRAAHRPAARPRVCQ